MRSGNDQASWRTRRILISERPIEKELSDISRLWSRLVLNQMGFPMAWTDIARAEHNRDRLRFPSDLTAEVTIMKHQAETAGTTII